MPNSVNIIMLNLNDLYYIYSKYYKYPQALLQSATKLFAKSLNFLVHALKISHME